MLSHWAGGGWTVGWRRPKVPQLRVPWSGLGWTKAASSCTDCLVPLSSSPLPPAAARGDAWQLGPHMCASAPRATEGPCVTTRMTLPTPAQPSSVTTGNATSQIKGSPTACASPALVGNTANKVGPPCASVWRVRGEKRRCPGRMRGSDLDSTFR